MFSFEPMGQVFFTNSGSEANDTQVRVGSQQGLPRQHFR